MSSRMVPHAKGSDPTRTVLAAYKAANQGRYSEANRFLAPEVRKKLAETHALTVATDKKLRRSVYQLKGRRDHAAAQGRKTLVALISSNRTLASIQLGSPRFLSGLWKAATRGRSIVKIEATREVIRRSRARVYLRLTLRDGTIVKDSEPLVLHQGKWFLG